MLIKQRLIQFGNKVFESEGSIWLPGAEESVIPKANNVLAVVEKQGFLPQLLGTPLYIYSKNIVTDAGDEHYAERLDDQYNSSGAPTNAFTTFEMATAGTPSKGQDRSGFTTVASSQKAEDTGYPKRNDTDPNNSGGGITVITHKVAYTTGDFSQNGITHGIITNTSPGASEPILTGWAFSSSFNKDSSISLTVFVNHDLNGV